MKKLVILLAVVLVGCQTEPQSEKVLSIQVGQFAFCGASAAVPTGKKITMRELYLLVDNINKSTQDKKKKTTDERAI